MSIRSRTRLVVHAVWATKDRNGLLHEGRDPWLLSTVGRVALSHGGEVLAAGASDNHVHVDAPMGGNPRAEYRHRAHQGRREPILEPGLSGHAPDLARRLLGRELRARCSSVPSRLRSSAEGPPCDGGPRRSVGDAGVEGTVVTSIGEQPVEDGLWRRCRGLQPADHDGLEFKTPSTTVIHRVAPPGEITGAQQGPCETWAQVVRCAR